MIRPKLKIGYAIRGRRAASPPAPTTPVVSVNMQTMTFNVSWDGTPVDQWELYFSDSPTGNFSNIGETAPDALPAGYWDWIGETNIDWALYVVGVDAEGTVITPASNILSGHSPDHY